MLDKTTSKNKKRNNAYLKVIINSDYLVWTKLTVEPLSIISESISVYEFTLNS